MSISLRKFSFFVVCLAMLALALPAMAQNRIVKGKVTDDKDQPIAGASVSIQALDSKTRQYNTKTDKKGTYIYMGLASGDYRVVVRAQGFSPEYVQPVRPNISSESVIDIKMSPGSDQKLPFEMSEQEMEQLKKEMERAEKRKQSSEEVKAFFEAGLQLVQQQKYPEAIEEFKKALEKDPEQASVIGNMADCYLKMDKKQEALDLYQKAIAISPNEAALYTNLGVVLNKMGKNAESQEAFKKAAALNPGASAQNLFNIGIVMYNNYQYAEAAEQFKQTIAADANYAEAYYRLGSCLLNMGQKETWPDAIKALQKYVQIGKDARNIDDAKAIISALEQSIKK